MKSLPYLFLFLMVVGCTESTDAIGEDQITETPIPENYLGFYAGMSSSEFKSNMASQQGIVLEFSENWTVGNDQKVIPPGFIANLKEIDVTCYIWEDKAAQIIFSSQWNTDFKSDLIEIHTNFEADGSKKNNNVEYRKDNLKTSLNLDDNHLELIKYSLYDPLFDEKITRQKQFDAEEKIRKEEEQRKIQEKYQ